MVAAPSPELLPARVSALVSTVIRGFNRHGLRVHLSPDKTACIIAWRGAGMKEVKRRVMIVDGATILLDNGDLLPVSHRYKYMGSMQHAGKSSLPDASHRARAAKPVVGPLKQRVLRNPLYQMSDQ
eukprot:9302276-Alexandrium_andersonii.AAC.1